MTRLDTRALNRALLDRQWLTRRVARSALEAVDHLVGLQAQVPNSPYIGLWSRLKGFDPGELAVLVTSRRVVRLALMRSTIHLVTARDALAVRPLVQPVVERGFQGAFGRRLEGLDVDRIAAVGRALVEQRPLTFAAVGALLGAHWPSCDAEALAQVVRTRVPLVQVPPRGVWGASGAAVHTSLEAWLAGRRGRTPRLTLERLLLRYLAAFGPAAVADAQVWSGLTGLGEIFERLRRRLRTYRDERGRELFDVPEAPRPRPDVDAPPRFLPEYDNILLAHADRSRIVADRHRPRALVLGGRSVGTVLVDGFVRARWQIAVRRGAAILTIRPFDRLRPRERVLAGEEGERLLEFLAMGSGRDVRFLRPG